jgi:hypothetical protein
MNQQNFEFYNESCSSSINRSGTRKYNHPRRKKHSPSNLGNLEFDFSDCNNVDNNIEKRIFVIIKEISELEGELYYLISYKLYGKPCFDSYHGTTTYW